MNKTDVGKALMMVGGCLAITLLAAFFLVAYGEAGSPTKVTGLFAAQLAMWPVFLVGFHLRFSTLKGDRRPAAKEMPQRLLPGALRMISQGVLYLNRK